ncbi:MAG: hypothetical protein ACRYE9_04470 [Janthinobacterium lividum]
MLVSSILVHNYAEEAVYAILLLDKLYNQSTNNKINIIYISFKFLDPKNDVAFRHILSIEGLDPAEFMLGVKATSIENSSAIVRNDIANIKVIDNTFDKLMLKHPEYKILRTVLTKLMEQEYLNVVLKRIKIYLFILLT